MYKVSFKIRVIKHYLITKNVTNVAKLKNIPKKTFYRWLKRYKEKGFEGLKNQKTGIEELQINSKFEKLVISIWNEHKTGVHKFWLLLNEKGFLVSERQLRKIYLKYNLKMCKRKRPSQIKFVKYEWPKNNDLWHTDWSDCPFTGKKLIAFIDDHSRYIIHAELFKHATVKNTIIAFEKAIKKGGKPLRILTDNGTQFTPARSEEGTFTKFCKENEIQHILGRVHHPQTNGKIERWFGTYKEEYNEEKDNLDSFVDYYNNERLHQALNYKRPKNIFRCDIKSV